MTEKQRAVEAVLAALEADPERVKRLTAGHGFCMRLSSFV